MTITIFLIALLSPLAYAMCNHYDKILLERYFKEGGVAVLMIFSSLLSVIAMLIFYCVDSTVFMMSTEGILTAMLIGLINTLLLWAYLKAMDQENPAVVIIFYQLVPVIGLIMSYFWLDETITSRQLVGMLFVIGGATIMSFLIDGDGKIRFRKKTVFYMMIASTCWAAESTLFKGVALDANVSKALFWEHASLVLVGIALLMVPTYRAHFKKAIRVNSRPIIGVNVLNEVTYQFGNVVAAFVVVLIPVSLTLMMNSFQPLFVLLLAAIMAGVAKSKWLVRVGYGLSRSASTASKNLGKLLLETQKALRTVEVAKKSDLMQIAVSITLMTAGVLFIGVVF